MIKQKDSKNQILIYKPKGRDVEVEVKLEKETIWLDAHQMARLFGVNRPATVKHINNIYKTGELNKDSTCSILEQFPFWKQLKMLFIYFLEKSDYLYRNNGERKFNGNVLTALCLLIAISNPKEKDKMIEITKNLISG